MGKVLDITTDSYEADVEKHEGIVLIDFWAPWCGPCKMQTPILEKLVADSEVTARITKCNTDDNPDIAHKFNIVSIPTLVLLENGEEIERFVGVQPEAVLKEKLM